MGVACVSHLRILTPQNWHDFEDLYTPAMQVLSPVRACLLSFCRICSRRSGSGFSSRFRIRWTSPKKHGQQIDTRNYLHSSWICFFDVWKKKNLPNGGEKWWFYHSKITHFKQTQINKKSTSFILPTWVFLLNPPLFFLSSEKTHPPKLGERNPGDLASDNLMSIGQDDFVLFWLKSHTFLLDPFHIGRHHLGGEIFWTKNQSPVESTHPFGKPPATPTMKGIRAFFSLLVKVAKGVCSSSVWWNDLIWFLFRKDLGLGMWPKKWILRMSKKWIYTTEN